MTKISPTDKIFDELIPYSPEYWEAIENIDCSPKPKRGFWDDIKGYFAALVQETTEVDFTPIRSFDDHLKELYPDVEFSVMRNEIRVYSKCWKYKTYIPLETEGWDIVSEQECKSLLFKVKCAVDLIRKEQTKLSALQEARRNRIRVTDKHLQTNPSVIIIKTMGKHNGSLPSMPSRKARLSIQNKTRSRQQYNQFT